MHMHACCATKAFTSAYSLPCMLCVAERPPHYPWQDPCGPDTTPMHCAYAAELLQSLLSSSVRARKCTTFCSQMGAPLPRIAQQASCSLCHTLSSRA